MHTKVLQLVGVSCMLIACKYEEIYAPQTNDFVYITDKAYTRKEVLDMERQVLNRLDFFVTNPSSLTFFTRFKMITELTNAEEAFGLYLLELALVDYKMLKYKPSMVAASAVNLVCKSVSKDLRTSLVGFTSTQLKASSKDLLILMQADKNSSLSAVRNKYSKAENFQVALNKI